MFKEVLEKINSYDTIIIHRHSNPDGDAIGCQVGLKLILQANFPNKRIFAVGDQPKRYAFIEESTPDEIPNEYYENALAIILDTSANALISDNRYLLADCTVKIDHHIYCEKIADIEVTQTSYESCCGLVAQFAYDCKLIMPCLAAKALYTGMITDSGRFRYDSTSPQTFKMAAYLLEQKFETGDIFRNLYSDDFEFIKLKAQFILKIQFTDKKVAYIYTSPEELATYNADTFTISRGMVNTMAEIKGVDVWANFTHTENGILVELRSSIYNVNQVAVKYGGGGHLKASGATLKSIEEMNLMIKDLNDLVVGD